MTGKGVARFLWWLIYAVAFYVVVFLSLHISGTDVLCIVGLSFAYEVGAILIKEAK